MILKRPREGDASRPACAENGNGVQLAVPAPAREKKRKVEGQNLRKG